MNDKKRSITFLIAEELPCLDEKNVKLENERNIKNLTALLNCYTNHDAQDDISDFLASSYRSFLTNSICEELKCATSTDLNNLIGVCLDIIRNNHQTFVYQNIYFISLNTLFFLLNKVDNVSEYLEYLSCKLFYDLIFANLWGEDNHIEIFAKLNYINFFISSRIFSKIIETPDDDDHVAIPPVNIILNLLSIALLSEERETPTLDKNRIIGSPGRRVSKNTNHDNTILTNDAHVSPFLSTPCIFPHLRDGRPFPHVNLQNGEIFANHINDKVLLYKRQRTGAYKDPLEEGRRKTDQSNGHSDTTMVPSKEEIIIKIYQTIIQLVMKFDLTIYIIHECINVLLNLCEKYHQELLLYDFLWLHKFFLKNDTMEKTQRFIAFIIQLITKCKKKTQKQLYFKLLKDFNSFLDLLFVSNSDIQAYAKDFLLSLNIANAPFDSDQKVSNQRDGNVATSRTCHIAACAQSQFCKITNLILFHMDYINHASTGQPVDEKDKETKYDEFFKSGIGQDPLLRSYINDQVNVKKGKLFCKDMKDSDKNTIIRNNIIEMEILVKILDCLLGLVPDRTSASVCFIFLFIHILKLIKKVSKNEYFQFPNEFFFFLKHLFIQAVYVLEGIDKMEDKLVSDQNGQSIIDHFSIQNEASYNKKGNETLFEQKEVKKMIERIQLRAEGRSEKLLLFLLEEMYSTVIFFLMPAQENWAFLNSSNCYFFKQVLLRISHFFYKKKASVNMMKFFFLDHVFRRIKEKTNWKFNHRNVKHDHYYWHHHPYIYFDEEGIISPKGKLNYKKYAAFFFEKTEYISGEQAFYFAFCLDYLKTFILFDESINYDSKWWKYKKLIISICKAPIFKYKFFLPARNTSSCFSQAVDVLHNVYLTIYRSGRGKKLLHEISLLLLLCCDKALRSIKRDNVIFYGEKVVGLKRCYRMRGRSWDEFHDEDKTKSSEKEEPINITNTFEKPFKEYYLNNSLPVFIKCLSALTDIVKLNIMGCCTLDNTRIIIKKSKIEKRKKKCRTNLKSERSLILLSHRFMCNFCKCLMKKTSEDFLYSARKYVLSFIQHFIALNTILTLKYKLTNRKNLSVDKILSFCFYNIFTDHDVSVFSIIYSIAFSLKNYLTLCGAKVKKSNHYLAVCDDLIFQIVDEYYSYDFPETNLWEEYISKTINFDSLKHTSVDCPGG
ncbi:conserved Plasmodium protein, unknown function [Plasmodium knowlesi strain H]|uniref:Uncharacterized protein n=3 Tax=Plasmodium knowlesi TaxID=5850 RepID=A0A5K1V9I0_PLAKH|nr:conserved Plasmodium protein, unknown function [Plasmodium knowlesi strain H]OTN66122.1 Uncharacterized protein PKNOH_S100037500 [Plasmodium knowlesi]CAA9987738.1 conserved Plasmodium protein, unknown function [Plasmodium knowlesi strain H]SBO27060.1 conserved Plasmodium protein, unknown function [Plasmodium knowlesi strain H]SBO29458.1 conserved Plasmodium protein, unknown function [Plasmodium knowlesi strain H]VVS77212.1 conserved Plasmodium protein, unknown function [Plasmodium knowlesi |eukprot:XP_002258735.1 hypothetical protein, conserved in Plasmodium species [Plasmodium knowlesi strain H]